MPVKRRAKTLAAKANATIGEVARGLDDASAGSVEADVTAIIQQEMAEEGAPPPPSSRASAWTPSPQGRIARRIVLLAIVGGAVLAPLGVGNTANLRYISLALIYVIVGLSVNMLMGYLGQISLGHQAFLGVGSFTAALLATRAKMPFALTIVGAGVVGAAAAILLGVVALRLKGLYLALITLAYGSVAQNTIFNTPAITGGGAGVQAIRPSFATANPADPAPGERAFVYLCMAFVVLFLYVDWRLVRSKVGRAIFAIRENELAAASFGINVTAYKLVAFVTSGILAGTAGALYAYYVESVDAGNYDFGLALTFVLMVVVGGLGSRVGVFIGSAFFALLDLLLHSLFGTGIGHALTKVSFIKSLETYPEFIGAVLLLMTLTLYPGGIAQQIKPFTNWLGGKRLREHGHTVTIREGGAGVRP